VAVIEENQLKGLNIVVWTPENHAEGIYYFRLQGGEQVAITGGRSLWRRISGKMVLMR